MANAFYMNPGHLYRMCGSCYNAMELCICNKRITSIRGVPVEELTTKETNPKDAVGSNKAPLSTVSSPVLMEMGLGMLEGSLKYGRHNYRHAGVRASVYYDAAMRHLMAWWEGQDIDPDSGINHIGKALASLAVLRDAMFNDKLNDDRPIPMKDTNWIAEFNEKAKQLIAKYPNPVPPFTKVKQ